MIKTTIDHLQFCRENFKVITEGSRRGKDLLVSSKGYSFAMTRQGLTKIYWRCSRRSCPSTVIQEGANFMANSRHNHACDPSIAITRVVLAKVQFYFCFEHIRCYYLYFNLIIIILITDFFLILCNSIIAIIAQLLVQVTSSFGKNEIAITENTFLSAKKNNIL